MRNIDTKTLQLAKKNTQDYVEPLFKSREKAKLGDIILIETIQHNFISNEKSVSETRLLENFIKEKYINL